MPLPLYGRSPAASCLRGRKQSSEGKGRSIGRRSRAAAGLALLVAGSADASSTTLSWLDLTPCFLTALDDELLGKAAAHGFTATRTYPALHRLRIFDHELTVLDPNHQCPTTPEAERGGCESKLGPPVTIAR